MAKSFQKYQMEVRAQNLNAKVTNIGTDSDSDIYPVIANSLKIPADKQEIKSDDHKKDK